jgi:osmotically-inducible protein OsmY
LRGRSGVSKRCRAAERSQDDIHTAIAMAKGVKGVTSVKNEMRLK